MQILLEKVWNLLEKIMKFVLVELLKLQFFRDNWDVFTQFVKFGLVGITNAVIAYVSYAFFWNLGVHYLLSNLLSFIISVTNSFYWNNKFVFAAHDNTVSGIGKAYIKMLISYGFTGVLLANVLLIVWVNCFNISEIIAPLINLLITTPLNFVINKFWTFR